LNAYYRVVLKPGSDAAAVSQQLAALPGVVDAYAEPLPAAPPMTPNFVSQQTYLGAAPSGIGANLVPTFPGARGGDVTVADVEYSWNINHEDLAKDRLPGAVIAIGTPLDPFDDNNHGTAVQGILVGTANTFGITGITPNAVTRMINADSVEYGYDPANAIATAAANLTAGDVILLEQQTWGPDNWLVPVEWIPSVYDAIRNATAAGIIVVEAAGNGGIDLDGPLFAPGFPDGKPDSGAIIVGAGTLCYAPFNSRMYFSNFGSRVNVQGPGECVTTTGYGDLYTGSGPNTWYTNSFNGTSSASAVVAGVVASASSTYQAVNAIAPAPATVRSILVDSGTAQYGVNGLIGPRPNLVAAERLIDTQAPSLPSTLRATLNTKNKVVLRWAAATDNSRILGYQIYRNGAPLRTTTNVTSFADTTVKAHTTYKYRVRAFDLVRNLGPLTPAVRITTR